MAKITFVVADIDIKVAVITSSVTKIILVMAGITFEVAVITASAAKSTFVVTDIILSMVDIRLLVTSGHWLTSGCL